MYEAERGLFELVRGRVLAVTAAGATRAARDGNGGPPRDGDGPPGPGAVVAAVEGLTEETLALLRSLDGGRIRLVVTEHRGRAMGLTPGAVRARGPVPAAPGGRGALVPGLSLGLDAGTPLEDLLRLSGASGARRRPIRGNVRPASPVEAAGLTLVRLGRLLPAVASVPVTRARSPELAALVERGAALAVGTREVATLAERPGATVAPVSDAPVPLPEAEEARCMLFRESPGLREHVAVLFGERERWPEPVPVRIHSACLTGDLFGSLRCDCGEQLRSSVRILSERGGVFLYLAQEGRSIGLGNKLRAYALQERGLDTVEADGVLGFGADERRYDAAVEILSHLEIERVQLLTNNPEKVRALEDGGIRVPDRRPLHGTLNRHNLPYVLAKARRAGHWLGAMLSSGVDGERKPAP